MNLIYIICTANKMFINSRTFSIKIIFALAECFICLGCTIFGLLICLFVKAIYSFGYQLTILTTIFSIIVIYTCYKCQISNQPKIAKIMIISDEIDNKMDDDYYFINYDTDNKV